VLCGLFWLVRAIASQDEITSPLGFGHYGQPVWSPDSIHLAFTFRGSGSDELWVIDITSRKTLKVATKGYISAYDGAAWQDNRTLWFIQDNALYKVDINDNKPVSVMRSKDGWEGLAFQSPTERLVFARKLITFSGQAYKPNDLFLFDPSTQKVTPLTNTPTLDERAPAYSVDGKRLAFAADDVSDFDPDKGGKLKPGLNILEQNGVVRRLDISVRNGANKLGWSPNSQYILSISDFDANGEYDPRLYLHRADGTGKAKKIITRYDDDGIFGLGWSPNGSRVAFTTVGTPGGNALHIIPSSGIGLDAEEYTQ
jgi:Tol biopolymer transport system component